MSDSAAPAAPPTSRQAVAALVGSCLSNLAFIAFALLAARSSVWALLAVVVVVTALAAVVLLGRMPPPAMPRETAQVVRIAGLPSVVTAVYLLLELAAVLAVGWFAFAQITAS